MAKKPNSPYRRRYQRLYRRLASWRRAKVGLDGVPTPLLIPLAEIDDLCALLADRLEADPDNAALRGQYLMAIRERRDYIKMLTQLVETEEEPKPNPQQADRIV